jgi:hypothetical protein
MAKDLAQATDTRAGQALNAMRTATVASVLATGGVMVSMNGAVVGPYAVVGSYVPAVGQVVSVIRQDASWLVLGPSAMPTAASGQQAVGLLLGWTASLNSIGRISLGGRPGVLWVASLTAGTKANGTIMGVIPAGLAPRTSLDLSANADVTVAAGQSAHFNMTPAGGVGCWGFSSATFASLCAIYPLDV